MRVAHFSDIHFGSEDASAVDALAQSLHDLSPDVVIASGDFTSAGRRQEFRDAAAFLEELAPPIVATPGNHDIPAFNLVQRLTAPLAKYRRHIGSVTADRFESRGIAVLALNSARPWDLSLNWSHGRLSDDQAELARSFFDRNRGAMFRALVVHHPFFVPEDLPGFRSIRNGEPTLRALADTGVHAVLAGHLHRQSHTTRRLTLEAGDTDVLMCQVSTAASTRRRGQPNAFAVLDIDRHGVRLTEQTWDGASFVPGPPRPVLSL